MPILNFKKWPLYAIVPSKSLNRKVSKCHEVYRKKAPSLGFPRFLRNLEFSGILHSKIESFVEIQSKNPSFDVNFVTFSISKNSFNGLHALNYGPKSLQNAKLGI